MKPRTTPLLAIPLLFALAAVAQHSQHHPPENAEPGRPKAQLMGEGMMGAGPMVHHQEMESLVNQLLDSQAALETTEDPGAFKEKLTQHRALLEKLKSLMKQRRGMMQEMMKKMEHCPMMQQEEQSTPK